MNTNKKATGSSSKRLLAALAVLAVAFVVLAAVPAVATDSDAADDDKAKVVVSASYAVGDVSNASLGNVVYAEVDYDGNYTIKGYMNKVSADNQGNNVQKAFAGAWGKDKVPDYGVVFKVAVVDKYISFESYDGFKSVKIETNDEDKGAVVLWFDPSDDIVFYITDNKLGADDVNDKTPSVTVSFVLETIDLKVITSEEFFGLDSSANTSSGQTSYSIKLDKDYVLSGCTTNYKIGSKAYGEGETKYWSNSTVLDIFGKTLNLDLNGHVLYAVEDAIQIGKVSTGSVSKSGVLNITGTKDGSGIIAADDCIVLNHVSGTTSLTINGGDYTALTGNAARIYGQSGDTNDQRNIKVSITDATLTSGKAYALWFGNKSAQTVTIEDSTFTGVGGAYFGSVDVVTVTGSNFNATADGSAVEIKSGNVSIKNSGIVATKYMESVVAKDSGSGGSINAISINNNYVESSKKSNVTVTLSGNTITNPKAQGKEIGVLNVASKSEDITVTTDMLKVEVTAGTNATLLTISADGSTMAVSETDEENGNIFTGSVSYTDSAKKTSKAEFSAIKGGISVSAGSIEIEGDFTTDSTGSIIVTGEAVIKGDSTIGSEVTLTVEDGATLTVAPGVTLTNDGGTLALVSADQLKLEDDGESVGTYVQVPSATTKVHDENTWIVGTIYRYADQDYVIHSRVINGDTIYYGVGIIKVEYTGSAVTSEDISSNFLYIANANQSKADATFTVNANGAFTLSDETKSAIGTYPGLVKVPVGWTRTVTTTAGTTSTAGSFTDKADLEITKISLRSSMISVDPIEYMGSAVTPDFTIKYMGAELDPSDCKITYESGTTAVTKLVNVGDYKATIEVESSDYFEGSATVTVKIVKAALDIEIIGDGSSWNYKDYKAESVYVTLPETYSKTMISVQVATALNSDNEPDYGVAVHVNKDSEDGVYYLDTVLNVDNVGSMKATEPITVYIMVSADADSNYNKGTQTATATVEPFETLEDFIEFSKANSDGGNTPEVDQKGYNVTLTGTLSNTAGKGYEYILFVKMNVNELVDLDFGKDGNAAFSEIEDVTVTPGTPVGNVYTVKIVIETALPVSDSLVLTVTADKDETTYTTQEYTISLASLIPADYRIIFSEGGKELDITENDRFVDAINMIVILPFTQADGCWTLGDKTYNGGSVYIIDAADMVEGAITFVATVPAEPEAEQVLDIVSVGYAAKDANDTINAALTAAGYKGDAVKDADPAAVIYIVFSMSEDGTIDFSIDGVKLKSFEFSKGVHAIYAADDSYVAGQTITLGIADGDASDSITYTFVGAAPVEPVEPVEPVVEYSTDVKAALRIDDAGVYLMLIAGDKKAIPSGEITVTYYYMGVDPSNPFGGESILKGTMTIAYSASDDAYAYIALDFASDAAASAVYDDIVGASAVFSDGTTSYSANMLSFTLPAKA